jgi:HEAT repeat protein/outer membrane protein assembly factor BamB
MMQRNVRFTGQLLILAAVLILLKGVTAMGAASPGLPSATPRFQNHDASYWLQQLGSTNRAVQRQAQEQLRAGGETAAPVLAKLLGADREPIRRQALDLICELGTPVTPTLIASLSDENANARDFAARGLGRLVPDSPKVVASLTKALDDPNNRVVWSAAFSLAAYHERAASATVSLARTLASSDPLGRTYAGDALAAIGPKAAAAIPTLVAALRDPDAGVRRAAATAIGCIGSPAAIPATDQLIISFVRGDPYVRIAAATALGAIGPAASNALPMLRAALADPTVRTEAELAMSRITGRGAGTNVSLASPAPTNSRPAALALPVIRPGEWPMLGGHPDRNAVATNGNPPKNWNPETGENILWQTRLGNQTYAAPVVAGGYVFVGTDNGEPRDVSDPREEGVLMAFAADTGRFLWQDTAPYILNNGLYNFLLPQTTSTPLVEFDRLYYVTAQAQLRCLYIPSPIEQRTGTSARTNALMIAEAAPQTIWELDLGTELGVYPHEAPNCSVVGVGDLLMVCTGNGVDSTHTGIPAPRAPSFIGVDKRSGRVVWQVVGPSPRVLHGQWSSPSLGRVRDRTLAFFGGGDGWVYALDPLTDQEQWRFDGNPKAAIYRPSSDIPGVTNRNSIIACPVFHAGRVYLTMGEDPTHGDGMGRLMAIAADGSGDITATGRVWEYIDLHRAICTPIIHDGLIYVGDNYGQVHCVDLETGKRVWIHDQMSRIWGCMALVGDRLYVGDEGGTMVVYRAGRKMEILAKIDMPGPLYGSPAVSGDTLYLATSSQLYAIRQKR